MKKFLSALIATVLATSMSLSAFAADVIEVGTDNFEQYVGANGTVVTKTVKSKKGMYKVTGVAYTAPAKEVLTLVNKARKDNGLPALEWVPELQQPAIQRALEQYLMDAPPYLSHTRPDGSGWSSVSKYANGENLAGGALYDAETVTDGWLNSPDHYDNIMEPKFTGLTVACVETDKMVYWVQLFNHDPKKYKATKTSEKDSEETVTAPTPPPAAGTVTAESIAAALGKAKAGSIATITLKDIESIPVAALKSAATWATKNKKSASITVTTSTSTGKGTQAQLTLNPASFAKNKSAIKTGVHVEKADVADAAAAFAKANPKAKYAIIKLDQSGSFGGTVEVAAKVDVSKMKTQALNFYYFDPATGKTAKINLGKNGYSIDKNKYLRFATTKGGYIVVTDTALAKM